MKKLKVVSLFSGIGGFEAGLNDSNIQYEIVFSSEIDPNAQISYLANFPNANLHGDITKINEADIPDHDLLCAGFPCQSFSIAGKQLGFEDTRGTLFFDVYRILKEKKPKFVLLENVKNLVSHDKSRTINVILKKLNEIGYTIDFDIINANEIGVPQNRERTYIVGILNHPTSKFTYFSKNKKINDLKKSLNKSTFNGFNFFDLMDYKSKPLFIEDILDYTEDDSQYCISNEKVDQFLSTAHFCDHSKKQNKILKLFDLPKEAWNDLERQRRVYSIKGISPTVLARSDSTKILLKKNGKYYIRKFTPKENFRVQGFDEDFSRNIISSGVSVTQLYKQSGNAVCPPVITKIINHLSGEILDNPIKFIDLFCGLGGFRIAGENNKMKCVFSCDIDKYVREVYKMNFNEYPYGDITKINEVDIPDHDLLCAGFPCQPFSLAGKRLGFEDTRGTLFFDVARIIKGKKPKFVLLENVAGLVNHDKGKTINVIKNVMINLDYHFEYTIMNSKDYGIPQNRLRWYGVGIRNDIYTIIDKKNDCFHFPEKCDLKLTLNDLLDETNDTEFKVSDKCLDNIKLHLQSFKESNRFNPIYPLIATEIRPSRCNFRCDGISPCLTAKMGTGGNNVPVIVSQSRKYTVKECLQLMGFPYWYRIEENKMQSYKQIGNSVVVPVVNLFIEEIARLFEVIKNE